MDLAPKYLYYFWLVGFVLGVPFVGTIAVRLATAPDGSYGIWALALMELFGLFFIMFKCRYVVQDNSDHGYFLWGNVFRHGRIQNNKLAIKKILNLGLYKVESSEASFFIIAEQKTVDEYLSQY